MSEAICLTPEEFEAALRAKGQYYHIHHPYHIAMHNGEATREQIQAGSPTASTTRPAFR